MKHCLTIRLLAAVTLASMVVFAGCQNGWNSHGTDFNSSQGSWTWEKDDKGLWRLKSVSPEKRIVQTVASNPDERREAIVWLATPERSSSDAIVRHLGTILEHDPDPTVRAAAARALAMSVNPESTAPLIVGCNDRNDFVRLDSVRGLSSKTGDNAKGALLFRLEKDARNQPTETNAQVRAAAATGLRSFHDRRAAEILIRAESDPDFAVVYAAEQSLIAMTGQTFEYDPAAWSRWLNGLPAGADPFARAGQVPGKLAKPQQSWAQKARDNFSRAWYWWQAESKPGGK